MLTRAALEELRRSIEDASGRDAADEILFRLGRRWGATDAGAIVPDRPLLGRLERGIAHMVELGLGRVTLEEVELDPVRQACRIAGYVTDPEAPGPTGREPPVTDFPGVTLGYLTGLASTLAARELVCSRDEPVTRDVPPGARPFELRPAYASTDSPSSGPGADLSLADLLENAGDAILLIDEQDVVRFWNHGAQCMFGYSRDEVVGRELGFLVPPDLAASGELDRLRRRTAPEGVLRNFVTRRVTREGKELRVSLTRTALRDAKGQVSGSTEILRDISEQLRTEDELHHARQLAVVNEMAAVLAHQVKNPLAGIHAAIQVLSRGLPENDENRGVFESIGAEIHRLDDAVVDLLRFSRPLPPRKRLTDLRRLLEELLETLRHDPEVARHELRLDLQPGTVLELDEAMLGPAFRNLILNAAQAMREPGQIRIWACADGEDHVVVVIEDEGPGIPEDRIESIFDPFITTKTRGTGLGLSIARKNVEAHGGTLVADRGLDAGARLRISLPRVTARTDSEALE